MSFGGTDNRDHASGRGVRGNRGNRKLGARKAGLGALAAGLSAALGAGPSGLFGSISERTKAKKREPKVEHRAARGRRQGPRRLGLFQRGLFGSDSFETRSRRELDEPKHGGIRIAIVAVGLGACAIAVLVRAGQLQLARGDVYEGVAERQAALSASISAKRGVIKDRHGSELAITVDVDSVVAEPKKIPDESRDRAARELAGLLGRPEQVLREKLSPDHGFVPLKRHVDPTVAAKVRELKIPGIATTPEPKRFYSNRELAAHVLGFSTFEGEGGAGIERQFDEDLRGKTYDVAGLRDALGKKVFVEGFVPPSVLEGADVTLTIDRQIQFAAEEALAGAVEQFHAKAGVAIVLETKTSEVLALASYPTYNPNNMKGATPDHQLDRAVSAVFEPGSTMKMVTVAGALESGVIRPDDRVDCEGGKLRVGNRTIGDSHKGLGQLSIAEILKVSSNVCAAKIGLRLGSHRLHYWLKALGLGEKTGIELPGELRGLVRPAESWREIALANIAFGQGISVTPLQIIGAASTIANGGKRVAPRIVRQVVDKSGRELEMERPPAVQVLSEKTAREVTTMLEEVTKKGGTAEVAAIPGFRVAGKTGTAQKIDPVAKTYSHELYVSSFVGFVPADRPEVTILVMIDEPKGTYYGGQVAAPAWKQIALAALSARSVFPSDDAARDAFLASYQAAAQAAEEAHRRALAEEEARAELPDGPLAGHDGDTEATEASENSGELALAPEAEGRSLSAGAEELLVLPGLGADPATAREEARAAGPEKSAEVRMPNFAGLKLHEVLNRSAEVHCDPVLTGTGRVVSQSPRAGDVLVPGARCELNLEPSPSLQRGSGPRS